MAVRTKGRAKAAGTRGATPRVAAARAEGHVFIACSTDGFIARPDGDIVWLTGIPVPEGEDYGYGAFIARMDAILMGRRSYEKVLGFAEWPYQKPVWVLSRTLGQADVPDRLKGRVTVTGAAPDEALDRMAAAGAARVYVDGGQVVQAALREGLIRRMTVTRIPILLGEGLPLFGPTGRDVALRLVALSSWANGFVQSVYEVG